MPQLNTAARRRTRRRFHAAAAAWGKFIAAPIILRYLPLGMSLLFIVFEALLYADNYRTKAMIMFDIAYILYAYAL